MSDAQTADPVVRLDQVSQRFVTDSGDVVHALAETDLSIRQGQFVCVVGPSGCGKTTLLKIIAGFLASTGGSAHYREQRITKPGAERFWAAAGETYLVTMDLQSTKPAGSDGRSMYLGVTLSCSPRAGGPGISEGGTQNMLTGEVTQYRNQGLISVPEDGAVDCSIKLNAPYDDVASTGTTFTTDGTWRAEPVGGAARAFDGEGLPRTVAVGADETVMAVDLPLDPAASGDLRTLSSIHLTACTGVNGSREEGRAWCSEGALDDAGSTVTTRLTAQLVDAGGDVCAELGTASTEPDHIDLYRHHRLLSLELTHSLPESPCGDTVRVSVSVHNDGPAPVVVHHANSSLVVL